MLDWLRGKRGAAPAAAPAEAPQARARAARERGNEHLAQDRFEKAAMCFQEAASLDPSDAATLVNLGFALCTLSRGAEARECLQRAAILQPDNHDAHYFLGLAREQTGDAPGAAESYARVIALKADFEPAYGELARVLAQLGRSEEAQSVVDKGLAAHPANLDLQFLQGNLALQAGRFAEAAKSFEHVMSVQPGAAPVHVALGQAYAGMAQWAAAARAYRRALDFPPADARTQKLLGVALVNDGQLTQAAQAFRDAVTLQPDDAEAHSNLGNVLRVQGRLLDALAACQAALALQPSMPSAINNLGAVFADEGRMAQALECYRRAVSLEPGNARFHSNCGGAHQRLGAVEEAIACYRRALELDPQLLDVRSNLLFALSIRADVSPAEYLAEAKTYGALARQAVKRPLDAPAATKRMKRGNALRVGLVSGDFRNHPVGFFLDSTLRCLNSARTEVIAYSTQPVQDSLTRRLRTNFSGWRDIWAMHDAQAAALVQEDGIDLLVDLAGHSQHNRLPLFACRAAPVQASWLGYFASSGVAEIDYYVADPTSAPENMQSQFTERLWRLPHTRLCFTAPDAGLVPGSLPALRNGYVTFGCFQNPSKFNRQVYTAWSRILQAMPTARLRLHGEFDQGERGPLAALASRGVSPDRVQLVGWSSRDNYLQSHQEVDLILDTFPYPGGTTTCEALWMGVPTLTLSGPTLLARQGTSLLTCAGLADWVAEDVDAYVDLAVRRAADLNALTDLRGRLREQVLGSPLFDASRFASDLEDAFHGMVAANA